MNLPRLVDIRAFIGRRIAGYVRSSGGAIRDGSPERGYVVVMDAAHYATYTALASSTALAGIDPDRIAADILQLESEFTTYTTETARGWPTDAPDHAMRGRVIAVLHWARAILERPTTEEPL